MTQNHPTPPSPKPQRPLFTVRGPASLLIVVPWCIGVWTIASWLVDLLR